LHPNAALRLGALQNGIYDITNHAFFAMRNIDFELLYNQEIDMPYKPNIMVDEETGHLVISSTIEGFESSGGGSNVIQSSSLINNQTLEALDIAEEIDMDPNDSYNSYFLNLNEFTGSATQ
jgi:hypothetical protein